MSRFLGPIHHYMYKKIQLQEELIRRIASEAKEYGWEDVSVLSGEVCREDNRPLEEVIDLENIHGWLQGNIDSAEGRYARLVTAVLSGDPTRLDVLKKIAFSFGAEQEQNASSTAFELYHTIDATLLNGMPCDRVNEVTVQEGDRFAWDVIMDVHSKYWNELQADPETYHILRNEIIRGILSKTDFVLDTVDNLHYEIRKNQ